MQPWLEPKPWGGRRLAELGIALPAGERIGEAHLASPRSTVVTGPDAGQTLAALAAADPVSWVGADGLRATAGLPIFPLLIKFITSETHLSIQVHPDDGVAAAAGLGTGKTEAYHILAATPESVLFLGLLPGVSIEAFNAACRRQDGSAARLLRRVSVRPGMTVLVPAGTIHAPGAGITLYEIQQPSNVTFRLDDWGRRDETGRSRTLHHAEGFAALDPSLRPGPIAPRPMPGGDPGRHLLVATPWFALEKIDSRAGPAVPLAAIASPHVLTCLAGSATVVAGGAALTASPGETMVIPAGCAADVHHSGEGAMLRGWVPSLAERETWRDASH